MCCNLSTIRTDATNSAIHYLFTNAKDNDFQGNLHFKRKSSFSSDGPTLSDESGGKLCKVSSKVINKGCEKVDKTIDIDAYVPEEFHLDEFSISDQGVLTFDGDLLFRDTFNLGGCDFSNLSDGSTPVSGGCDSSNSSTLVSEGCDLNNSSTLVSGRL